jgi:hypothetical protein
MGASVKLRHARQQFALKRVVEADANVFFGNSYFDQFLREIRLRPVLFNPDFAIDDTDENVRLVDPVLSVPADTIDHVTIAFLVE